MARIVLDSSYVVNPFVEYFGDITQQIFQPKAVEFSVLTEDYPRDISIYRSDDDSSTRMTINQSYQTLGSRLVTQLWGYDLGYSSTVDQSGDPTTIITGTVSSFSVTEKTFQYDPSVRYFEVGNQTITATVSDILISAPLLDPLDTRDILTRVNFGDDQIFGSMLIDVIDAGEGDDEVYANDGNDVIFGFGGNDSIYGENGNDLLNGDDGDDLLFGGAGNDSLFGLSGNDWLVGGEGADGLSGGDGDDGIVYDANDNPLNVAGGLGFDTLFVDGTTDCDPFNFDLAKQGFEQGIISRVDANHQIWATNANVYNTAWQLVKSDYTHDDGSRAVYCFDPTDCQDWCEIRSFYATDGRLDYEQTYFDDGTTMLLDFDLNNSVIWYSRTMKTNTFGEVISDAFVLDASLHQRSSEIGAMAKKVFVEYSLL